MEISNKTLALFLVGAIVVSLAGTIVSLNKLNSLSTTGFVTQDTGTASLNVQSSESIRFAIDAVDFGTGGVNTTGGFDRCVLVINASSAISKVGCLNFNAANAGGDTFIVENDGNRFLNVTINSTDNADDLVGGTGAINSFKWVVANNESSSCLGHMPLNTTWTEITKTDTWACQNLSYIDTSDSLRVGINITIPYDANTGATSATLTITGNGI